MTFDPTLYFITDSTGLTQARLLEIVAEACQGGATLVQLREKTRSTRAYLELALAVKTVTDAYQVPLIIDDRVDIALASGAAGVHLGAEDLPVALARRLMGPDRIVGATAKTVERALQAQEEGAPKDSGSAQHHHQFIAIVLDILAVLIPGDLDEAGNAGSQQHHCDDNGEKAGGGLGVPEPILLQANHDEHQCHDGRCQGDDCPEVEAFLLILQ